ncbi:hypothetical protein FIBSPDRAFT_905453 [Athelia psychrophila]|uniref:Uncharacterized protein n=1 Tax=Athelia psychrophila TaxID=1759441 RepID=A0A167TFB7_9AGAM|nr:hypothetical protein FIBSPDRAFT_905453 [Fibularhizoctonia sp. CBS 109695]
MPQQQASMTLGVAEEDIVRFLKIIRRQQRVLAVILQYDCLSRRLTIWYWPINELWERRTGLTWESILPLALHARAGTLYTPYTTTVPLDRLYTQSGLRLRRYACRCCPSNDARLVQHSEDRHGVTGRAENANVQHDDVAGTIARLPPMTVAHAITEDCLWLSQIAVLELLAKCGQCSRIMTRRAFNTHACTSSTIPIIIDLTSDDDSES